MSVENLIDQSAELLGADVVGAQVFERELAVFGGGFGFVLTLGTLLARARREAFPASALIVATATELGVFAVSLRTDGWFVERLHGRWPRNAVTLGHQHNLVRLQLPSRRRPLLLRPYESTAWGEPLL